MITYDEKFKDTIQAYYIDYYRRLGLPSHGPYATDRLQEDEWELTRMKNLEKNLLLNLNQFPRHLIVGLGTGGLAVALKELGVKEIHGIEPYPPALKIARHKGDLIGLPASAFRQARAESLPYPDKYFDFIHCFSVLEHVQNVRLAIREMYRVIRTGGILYIHTPDYSWPYEGHYKVPAPTFIPFAKKTFAVLWLLMLGRPIDYIRSVNLFSSRQLNNILKKEVPIFCRMYSEGDRLRLRPKGKNMISYIVRAMYTFFDGFLGVYPYQEIIVIKR